MPLIFDLLWIGARFSMMTGMCVLWLCACFFLPVAFIIFRDFTSFTTRSVATQTETAPPIGRRHSPRSNPDSPSLLVNPYPRGRRDLFDAVFGDREAELREIWEESWRERVVEDPDDDDDGGVWIVEEEITAFGSVIQ